MAGLSNYTEKKVLDHLFGATSYATLATVYVGLFTTLPIDDGTGGVEPSTGSYARVSVTNNTTNWPNATGGDPSTKSNGTIFTFPTASADWGTIVGVGIFDASSSGNLLAYESFLGTAYLYTAIASTDVLTAPGYTPSNDQTIRLTFAIGGTVPTGLSLETTYYIINASGNTFKVSTSQGGSAVNITADGSGLFGNYTSKSVINGTTASFQTGALNIYLD